MGCNYPVGAYKLHSGEVVFALKKGMDLRSEIKISCGECTGCKLERARVWAIRCMHEAKLHERNCFITLTYDDDNLPDGSTLNYAHFQLFMKRLRKRLRGIKIRFYMAGEYGEEGTERPHYHALIFGWFPEDATILREKKGYKIYTSAILAETWGMGFCTVGHVTFETAQYTARYVMKKQNGYRSDLDYKNIDCETGEEYLVEREFNRMSLKPGIGAGFYEKYKSEIFPHDRVVMNGKEVKPPKYYYKMLEKENPEMKEEVAFKREIKGKEVADDNTEDRLRVKERVMKAMIAFGKRRNLT